MSRAALLVLTAGAWWSPLALAETAPLTAAEARADQQFTTYAYAHEFGSGIYDFNGRTLQVYTLPFSWTLQQSEGTATGWRLRLPVTLGFLDFKSSDVISTGLPDSVDSVTFVPGLQLTMKVGEHWTFLPYVQAGASAADESDVETRLFGAGLRAERSWPVEEYEGSFAGEFGYSGVRYRGELPDDDFVRLRNGVSLDRAIGRARSGHTLRVAFFSYVDVYLDPPTGPATGIDVPEVQFESGFLLDTRPGLKFLRLPVPGIGLSYRFAGDLSSIRFVIGAPY